MDPEVWIESWHLDQSVLQKNEFSRQGKERKMKYRRIEAAPEVWESKRTVLEERMEGKKVSIDRFSYFLLHSVPIHLPIQLHSFTCLLLVPGFFLSFSSVLSFFESDRTFLYLFSAHSSTCIGDRITTSKKTKLTRHTIMGKCKKWWWSDLEIVTIKQVVQCSMSLPEIFRATRHNSPFTDNFIICMKIWRFCPTKNLLSCWKLWVEFEGGH